MEPLAVSSAHAPIQIQSHKGVYQVEFIEDPFLRLAELSTKDSFFLIDEKVYDLYESQLRASILPNKIYKIKASEAAKDLSEFTEYISVLSKSGVKRSTELVIVGGGVLQDIGCFIAAVLFRGIRWSFFPTTLLAQADSCIGSKSSINVSGIKNLVGTFTPPNHIYLSTSFLKTLSQDDLASGMGEIIKVHGIAGIRFFKELVRDFSSLSLGNELFMHYLVQSLMIKKKIIEVDEFDTGTRLVMNYGHTFGHAIESATNYLMPHGIAITVGQSMACHYAHQNANISSTVLSLTEELFSKNYRNVKNVPIDFEKFLNSISKDKKNVEAMVALIIPVNDELKIERYLVKLDDSFKTFCHNYFTEKGFRFE